MGFITGLLGLGGGAPAPPPPPPNPATMASQGPQMSGKQAAEQAAAAAGSGMDDTLKTGPQGAAAPATAKAVLGG